LDAISLLETRAGYYCDDEGGSSLVCIIKWIAMKNYKIWKNEDYFKPKIIIRACKAQ